MTDTIEFTKLSGSGNDFICIDNRDGRYDALLADGPEAAERAATFARALCSRGHGIGADGVIFASRPDDTGVADIAARFLESDGSDCELCGNGTACFVHWVVCKGWVPIHRVIARPGPPGHFKDDVREGKVGIRILTRAGVVLGQDLDECSHTDPCGSYVRVCIPLPQNLRMGLDIRAGTHRLACDYVETGIPHVVTYVEDIEQAAVPTLGPLLRHHDEFQPRGANANFVQVLREGEIALRTFEFGVEGETLACGTGSAAAAILAALRHDWPEEYTTGRKAIRVCTRGGDVLRVYFAMERNAEGEALVSDACLETVVRRIFHGQAHEELVRRAWGAVPAAAEA